MSHDRVHGSSATVRLDFYLNDLFELQSEVKLDEAKFNDENSLVRLESVEAIGKKQKKERLDPPETKDRLRQVISTERREQTVSSSSTSVDQSSNEEEPSRQVDENVNPTNDRNRQLTETSSCASEEFLSTDSIFLYVRSEHRTDDSRPRAKRFIVDEFVVNWQVPARVERRPGSE